MRGRKTGGRKRGTPNKLSHARKTDVQAFCAAILDDAAYRETLRQHAIERRLAPAIEVRLWHYGVGIPRQIVEVDAPVAPIFTIARLPDLTPELPRLPSVVDPYPDPSRTVEVAPPTAAEPSPGRRI